MRHHFDCEAAAAMLHSGRVLVMASHAAALIAGLTAWGSLTDRVLYTAVLILWPAVCWFGIRVAVDASLFRAMAADAEASAEALDKFLMAQNLAKSTKPRSIEQRIRAALNLWRMLSVLVSIQVACIILAKTTA